MAISLLHTPEGVRDVYDAECARKLEVQKKITGVLHSYGYSQIETARQALENAGISPEDIGACVVATFSSDYLSPSAACMVQRGLGLTLVKDYVENIFCGTIEVQSEKGKYTDFVITMPKTVFEEESDEVLHS